MPRRRLCNAGCLAALALRLLTTRILNDRSICPAASKSCWTYSASSR